MKKSSPVFQSVRHLTVAAMLTAISVVIGIFCKNFLNFGGGLFRITFENFPIILSGYCFGPVVGGLVGIATDLISYLLSNQIYPPNLIVTAGAFLIGFVSGLLFRVPVKNRTLRIIFSASLAHFCGSVVVKSIGLYQFYGVAVLWRIPVYLVIASLEILLICLLFNRKSFLNLIDKI